MEHKLILQAFDKAGNMYTWKYYTIKGYLANENHVHDDDWEFYKALVNGAELAYSDKWPNLMRNVGDFKTYCRRHVDRKKIDKPIPKDILRKFLLSESEDKRNRTYQAIQKGQSINEFYNNGGGGFCEYRPGYISGYDFFGSNVTIKWINEDADVCIGNVSRTQILNEIKALINEGIYCEQTIIKPKIVFVDDGKQLEGQLSITDFLTV